MGITLDAIYRYPVKGLRGERLDAVALAAGDGLPDDRRFAIVRGSTRFDAAAPGWVAKQKCVMLMRDAMLARLACRVDLAAGTIELRAPGEPPCVASFATADGRARIDALLDAFLGPRPDGRARFVEAGPLSFTDLPENCVSLINLESVKDLENRVGRPVHPLRFRGNLYVRGGAPWEEFDWVGHEVTIGGVRLRIPTRIPRCAATGVDPDSGERDLNVVKSLRAQYGHSDMGVYAEVLGGGRVAAGDLLVPPGDARRRSWLSHQLRFARFIARNAVVFFRRR